MTPTELYAYHRWANRRLFDLAAALGEEACARDFGKPFSFPTLLRTLAHLYGADWIWLARWKGQTTGAMMAEFFYYKTPEFVFFIIPLTVLIAVMVTIGILTKNSELVVMQACGISLYRVAIPLVVLAIAASGSMFLLQDRILPYSNRRAQALRHVIRGGTPRTFDVVNRKWLVARNGSI